MCAFVVRGPGQNARGALAETLTLVDLGPIDAIERAVADWREAVVVGGGPGVDGSRSLGIGAAPRDRSGSRGRELRALNFDPVKESIGDVRHLVVVPDDVVQLVRRMR